MFRSSWFLVVSAVVILTLLKVHIVNGNTTIRPNIARKLCRRVLFSGLDEEYVATPQLAGVYELQNFTWNDFPVFKVYSIRSIFCMHVVTGADL